MDANAPTFTTQYSGPPNAECVSGAVHLTTKPPAVVLEDNLDVDEDFIR
jgi:hypothetical protein